MELVAVIAIIAIVSVFAVAQFSGGFARTRGFYDEFVAQLTFARRIAVAQRRVICVHVSAAQSSLFYADAAGTSCPGLNAIGGPLAVVPSGSALLSGTIGPPATFQFDALGAYRASNGSEPLANLVLTISGDGSYVVTVERLTGYVR
jgi:MSHA pilin protein MshC